MGFACNYAAANPLYSRLRMPALLLLPEGRMNEKQSFDKGKERS